MIAKMYKAAKDTKSYQNPLLFGNYADPSILKDGDDYFMVHGGYPGCGWKAMLLWHSKDLVNWTPMYHIAEQKGIFEGKDGYAWAPDLIRHNGKYYLYNFGVGIGTYVMTCDDIWKGEWSDPVLLPEAEDIDPGHVVDENGNRYLCMSKNVLYPLSEDGLKIIGAGIKICEDWPIPDEWDVEGICTESPKFTKKDGYYYLTVAQGGTVGPPTSHAVISMRSRSPFGPYEFSPYNPIVHTWSRAEKWWSTGHGTLVEAKDGSWVIIYHGINSHYPCFGRMTLMEPIEWDENGWFKIKEGTDRAGIISFASDDAETSAELRDDFSDEKLGCFWNSKNISILNRVRFGDGLVMTCQGKNTPESEPLLFTQWLPECEVVTKATVNPGAGAALVLYNTAKVNCGIKLQDGKVCMFGMGKNWYDKNAVEYQADTIYFKLKLRDGVVSPWYSADGENYHKLNYCFDISSWGSNSTGCAAVTPGLMAFGQGQVKYHWFEIRE